MLLDHGCLGSAGLRLGARAVNVANSSRQVSIDEPVQTRLEGVLDSL